MDMISGLRHNAAHPGRPLGPSVAAAFSLDGRTAVVTGAAAGLGAQAATTFAEAGANVVLADVNADGLEATAAAVRAAGVDANVVPTDMRQRDAVEDLARRALRSMGRVDVWANVAGIIATSTIVETSEEQLDAIVAVNLKGVFFGVAAAGRLMSAAGRGSIINIASAGGEMPAPTLSCYAMTKAAVIQLTRVAAAEFGPRQIRVNAVAPGFVDTPMTQRLWTTADGELDDERRAAVVQLRSAQSPMGVTGQPADIAYAMLYLAADASRFVTGQVLRPNGGVYMA